MILVKEFRKSSPGKYGTYSTGFVDVIYWDIGICCEVVILKDRSKVWFKIPQFTNPETGKKVNMIMWTSKSLSDAFQDEIREQLAEKFPQALYIPDLQEIRKKQKKHKSAKKKTNPSGAPTNKGKVFENPPPFKARSNSKFQK